MLLSVYMPHSGRDEEDHIEALESVRATLTEGKRAGAFDFFFGGDIELRLDSTDNEHQSLDRIEWYGMYGPECRGEDTIAYGKIEVATTIAKETARLYHGSKGT